jgi:hypothetical protein
MILNPQFLIGLTSWLFRFSLPMTGAALMALAAVSRNRA